jgi:hypothetical protein
MEPTEQKVADSTVRDRRILTAMFADRESTDKAYQALQERGYTKEEINLVMSEDTRRKYYPEEVVITETAADTALEGAAVGSAIGGTIGAIAGVVAAVTTSLVIPGLGLVLAGPIFAGLAGAGAGMLAGGMMGALGTAGIPEAHAKIYESGIKKGNIVLGVHPRNEEDADYFEKRWREDKGADIYR